MKTLYLDIFSGISGDMFIGAMLDLGVDARKLERELNKLKVDGYHLHVARGQKAGIFGVKFDVHLSGAHEHHHHGPHHDHDDDDHHHDEDHDRHDHHADHDHHRHDHDEEGHGHHHHDHGHDHPHHDDSRMFAQIEKLIARSRLSAWVKEKSIAVFRRIAEAEGKIHGLPPARVHFHEVGAIDSIIDIVGACVALEQLGKPRVLAAPVVEGTGWIDCAHGRLPVPAPATLAILTARGIGLTQCDEPHELVTPTGAALLAEFVESFGPMDGFTAEKIGFGLGTRENRRRPNVLRAVLGKSSAAGRRAPAGPDWETDRIAVLETNLDDINAEVLGYFLETALAAGALDVFHTPVQMKKNRPGVLLTVLCAEADADRFAELILRETTAFGVRRTTAERRKLRREFTGVKTPFGEVAVKTGRLGGAAVQVAPEFESCRKLAEKAGVPLKQVYAAAVKAARDLK